MALVQGHRTHKNTPGADTRAYIIPRLERAAFLLSMALIVLLIPLLCSQSAYANTTQTLEAIKKATKQKDFLTALERTRELETELAARAPLEIVDLQVLPAPPQGIGMYTPLFKGELHTSKDEIYVYAHVRNHGISKIGGFYHVYLVSDLTLLNDKGEVVAEDPKFGESRYAARVPHRDTLVVIALKSKGIAKGVYTLKLTLHDYIGKKEASRVFEFSVL